MPEIDARLLRASASVSGRIEADFARVRGQTQLIRSAHAAPLKIAKTFPDENGGLRVCVMDCSPGLLAGDCYELQWRLEEGARVHLTNQSFTKIHPSRGRPGVQNQRICVARGALLELFPLPVMPFRDADFRSSTRVEIDCGGALILSDILCAGRIGRDEFEFAGVRSKIHVRLNSELVHCGQTRFEPHLNPLRVRGAWDMSTHVATFGAWFEGADADLVGEMRVVLRDFPTLKCGVSLALKHGVVASMTGMRAWEMQHACEALRVCARRKLAQHGGEVTEAAKSGGAVSRR